MHLEEIKKATLSLLTEIFQSRCPASEIISCYTRSRRYIGSKDRHLLTDMVWKAIRYHAHLEFQTHNFEEQLCLLDNIENLPSMPDWVKWECPEWIIPHIPNADKELPALISSAPIVLRVNGDRNAVQKKLHDEGIETEYTLLSPFGLVLKKRTNLETSACYKQGLIEIQDEGSQLVAIEATVKPNEHIFDMCAGAGGKSLIFSQLMHNRGHITAYDISSISLSKLQKRAQRAHARNIYITHTLPYTMFDLVVVDAPCSGTGTWRRCPDAKWKITPEQLASLVKKQSEILDLACTLSKERLCYITCSLTLDENENQVDYFLNRHKEWTCIKQKRFSPYFNNTDGFFVAVLKRKESV